MTTIDMDNRVRPLLSLAGPALVGWVAKFWLPGFGKRIVILNGHMQSVETAEFFVKLGREVTILDTPDKWGKGMLEFNRVRLIPWLAANGTVMLNQVEYEQITDQGIWINTNEGERKFIEADTIIVSIPPEPDTSLYEALKVRTPEVYLVGDAKQPAQIVDAIESARRVACAVKSAVAIF
jgi:2-enoate reductase